MALDPLSILLVEDNPGDARLVVEGLNGGSSALAEIEHAQSLAETLNILQHQIFDAILLDLSLPDIHGLDTLRKLRASSALPIVVLTGAEDDRLGLAALQEGAQDYLVKGEIPDSLLVRSIRYAIERSRTLAALRRSEERYELAIAATRDGIWDWDLLTDTVEYSERWRSMLGYEEADVNNTPEAWLNRVHHSDRGYLQDRLQAHLDGRTPLFECEYRVLHNDGELRWMLARGLVVSDDAGVPYRMVGSQSDITDRKQAEMRLQQAAFRDPLTGLDNRAQIKHGLEQALAASARRTTGVAVLFLDLDNFKTINDTLGHSAGDQVLKVIARRLTVDLRGYDRIARFGGDEFMILIDDLESVSQAQQIATRVLESIAQPIRLTEREVTLSASIGITTCMTGMTNPEYLLQAADVAMYHAKGKGKNRVAVFEPAMMNSLIERMEIEHLLRRALEERFLQVEYQPIVDLETSQVVGIEALARLKDDVRGWIPPTTFIPIAESSGLMVPLGEAVFQRALEDTIRLHAVRPGLIVSINVSASQLQYEGFVASLMRILDETGFDPSYLTLEITETSVMDETQVAIDRLRELKNYGITIAIDDFGTGHSSLSVLRALPVDVLKVDRTFTRRMETDADGLEIVRLITVMAQALRLSVIAEGIETVEQMAMLQALACELGQGFLISRPVSQAVIESMLSDGTRPLLEEPASIPEAPSGPRIKAG